MPNHYHLLVRVLVEEFGRCVMHPLTVSFTKAINKQQGRVGPLFQGPFKARPVTCDEDLVALSRYIHRNPVAAGLVSRPEEWEFSSYREYTGARGGTLPQPAAILGLFPSIAAYAEYVGEEAEASGRVPKALLIVDE